MKLSRIVLAGALVLCLAGVAYVGQRAMTPGVKMAQAAQKFVDGLTAEQKAKALIEFDSKERTNWHFVPREDGKRRSIRKGLPLKDMTAEQKKAAMALVAAGTSARGNQQATTIMSLEAILRDLEKGNTKSPVRDPEWYFFSIFGNPSKSGKWGWRVEGHHLSLNFTLDGSEVVSTTPTVFAANPANVKGGDRKGLRTLPEVDDLARDLFKSLDDEQKKVAYRDKPFPEPQQNTVKPSVGPPTGVAVAKMTDKQRGTLMKLVEAYAHRMPPELAAAELKDVRKAGVDKIHFAYSGATELGKGHTYRVHGPTFVIEFLNMQADSAGNPANHIHSCWRRLAGDFGITK